MDQMTGGNELTVQRAVAAGENPINHQVCRKKSLYSSKKRHILASQAKTRPGKRTTSKMF
jgi:hypothetical protein